MWKELALNWMMFGLTSKELCLFKSVQFDVKTVQRTHYQITPIPEFLLLTSPGQFCPSSGFDFRPTSLQTTVRPLIPRSLCVPTPRGGASDLPRRTDTSRRTEFFSATLHKGNMIAFLRKSQQLGAKANIVNLPYYPDSKWASSTSSSILNGRCPVQCLGQCDYQSSTSKNGKRPPQPLITLRDQQQQQSPSCLYHKSSEL